MEVPAKPGNADPEQPAASLPAPVKQEIEAKLDQIRGDFARVINQSTKEEEVKEEVKNEKGEQLIALGKTSCLRFQRLIL